MEITEHAKLRYVQRVVGIEDENKAWNYVRDNEYKISYELLDMYNKAKLLYKNYSVDKGKEMFNYYVNGETLLVLSHLEKGLITVYDMKVHFDDRKNRKTIKEYVKEIRDNSKNNKKLDKKKKEQDLRSRKLEAVIEELNIFKKKEYSDCDSIDVFKGEKERELDESVSRSREIVKEMKSLRMRNRDLMTELLYGFKKYDR